jgi:hypothetical protein
MYSTGPVGYQIHIKKRRPGLIVFLTITIIGLVALILNKAGFDYKNTLSSLYENTSVETDQSPIVDERLGLIAIEGEMNNQQIGKLGLPIPHEVEIKNKIVYNESNRNTDHPKNSGTIISGSINEEVSDLGQGKTETPFSQPEYFSFGIGSSGTKTTNEALKEIENDTTRQSKLLFYVIVSSVDTKELAEKQKEKFMKMSAQSGYVYVPSLNKYRVYIGYYSNLKEATSKSKSFQNNYPSYKPWIWKN